MVRKLKHTDIGDIPVDWELQTFDETFRVLSNNTLSRENLNNRGGAVRNIHYGDILTKFPEVLNCKEEIPYVNELSLLSSSTQLLQDGDIVIADTAEDETVGKVTEVQNLGDSKLVAGLHTIPCRVKKGDFAPGWLGYYMNSNLFHNQILPYITGIKVSSISKGAISETLILVPPFDEQEKIVQSLNEVQLLMTAETKVVNKMKFVKNGCLSKMFPQKDATVPEMRLPGFTEAWEQRKLGDEAIEMMAGGDIDKEKVVEDGKYPIYANALTNDGIVGYYNDYFRVKAPAVTVTGRGEVGHAQARMTDFTPVVRLLAIRSNHDCYFLENAINNHKVIVESTGVPQLTVPQLASYNIFFPSKIEEEVKIGEYFNNLDNLITLHQRKCDDTKELKKYMLQKMFPKNGEKFPEIRFKGFTEAWEQRKLGEILERRVEQRQQSWEYPRLAFASGQGVIPLNERKTNNREQLTKDEFTKKYLVTELDDIVYNPANVKYGAIDRNKCGRGLISPIYVTFTTSEIPGFIERIVTSHDFQQKALRFEEGTVTKRQSVNPEDFVTIDILVAPQKEEQRKISEYFDSLDKLITLHQCKCDKYSNIKKGMMSDLLTGKIRLV